MMWDVLLWGILPYVMVAILIGSTMGGRNGGGAPASGAERFGDYGAQRPAGQRNLEVVGALAARSGDRAVAVDSD